MRLAQAARPELVAMLAVGVVVVYLEPLVVAQLVAVARVAHGDILMGWIARFLALVRDTDGRSVRETL